MKSKYTKARTHWQLLIKCRIPYILLYRALFLNRKVVFEAQLSVTYVALSLDKNNDLRSRIFIIREKPKWEIKNVNTLFRWKNEVEYLLGRQQ